MHDPNRLIKWLLIIAMVVVSLVVLYPPNEKLKGGIDLAGGTSLLFEIDTTDLKPEEQRGLSTRVMRILKDRVDPKGQMNLEWRPVGNTRLEIRMPRPPKEALARRELYNQAVERLGALNLKRRDVEEALNATGPERVTRLAALERGAKERTPLLAAAMNAFDAHTAAQVGGEAAAITTASAAYEKAMSDLLATSLPVSRFNDVVALPPGEKRNAELQKLRAEFPSYDGEGEGAGKGKLLTTTVAAYDAWASNKADLEDPSDLKRRLRGAGVLEFRILADRDPGSPENTASAEAQLKLPIKKFTDQLAKYGPKPKGGDRYRWFPLEDVLKFTRSDNMADFESKRAAPGLPIIEEYAGRYYVLMHNDPQFGLLQGSGKAKTWALRTAYPDRDPMTGENVVNFRLDARGGRQFGELTGANVNRQLCIVLDNTAVSHANIKTRITEACQISGKFTSEQVQYLVGTLEAGSLPARLKETPLSEQTVGPSLGETNRRNGVMACVLGGALVALFILFYYGVAGGGVANLALVLNLLFTLAMMALMQATFTLPGIAGIVLTIGMAVDANVLIFERIREERARGLVFKKALNAGYEKAFSAIFDSNLTTVLTCVILAMVASEEVKAFGITLGLGLAVSMFTALFCTRLAFNSLVAIGWLSDFRMQRMIHVPKINWIGLRKYFLPTSGIAVTTSLVLFIFMSVNATEKIYDIEFLGGTSIQLDFKPGVAMTDEQVRESVTATEGGASAVRWLLNAADQLAAAKAADGEVPGQYTLTSNSLSGDHLVVLMRRMIEPKVERDGVSVAGNTARFEAKPGQLNLTTFKEAVAQSATEAREAANKLRGARVQSVGEHTAGKSDALSFEVSTVETNRPVVQAAILAVLGDQLAVQRAIRYNAVVDPDLTRDAFFVIEADDQYLSDVIGGDAGYDIRRFRGGVAVQAVLDETEPPLPVAEFERRLREVGLQSEFEQYRARESAVFPLGAGAARSDGTTGYKRFAVCSLDDSILYDDDPVLWTDSVARTEISQIQAALGSEKSLSKVIQFAPQIAGQTTVRAVYAMMLSMLAVGIYVWMRFGNKDFGSAGLVALFHDVSITLGLISLSHLIHTTWLAKALLITDFKIDLPMVAAILTIIGYSINDTIVVFDRVRENRGKSGTLSASLFNDSVNQTLSRTVLTSLTVFLVVAVLYVFGGEGVHGFAVAMMIGVIVGTYSSIGVAVALVYEVRVHAIIVRVIIAFGLIVMLLMVTPHPTTRWVLGGLIVLGCAADIVRRQRGMSYVVRSVPIGA